MAPPAMTGLLRPPNVPALGTPQGNWGKSLGKVDPPSLPDHAKPPGVLNIVWPLGGAQGPWSMRDIHPVGKSLHPCPEP